MASISRQPNGRRIIQVVCPDGKRRSIRLGKVTQHMAETVKLRVELLVAAKLTGHAIDDETARWLVGLEKTMIDKLAAVGLVPERESSSVTTVASFLTDYVSRRVDVKPATREVWRQIERNLLECFGAQRDLRTIDETAAEDFKIFMLKANLASTTIAKRLQFARQFFKAAVRRKLIPSNPFAEVSVTAIMNPERERFITREETAKLLAACPNIDWRVIVALCRFGGLRCPSEVLTLKWADIDWENGRFRIHSPKTEHHPGKDTRVAPLFPELRAILEEAREAAAEGAVYVVSNDAYRAAADTPGGWRNCNLRTRFNRVIKRAGLEPWPRRFHALRASRETELVREHPIHVVTAWLGNTPQIALKHYLMVTDSDFSNAIGRLVDKAVQNGVQQNANSGPESSAATSRGGSQDLARKRHKTLHTKVLCETVRRPSNGCLPPKRRARESNPQRLAPHLISSQAANHSRTLQKTASHCYQKTCDVTTTAQPTGDSAIFGDPAALTKHILAQKHPPQRRLGMFGSVFLRCSYYMGYDAPNRLECRSKADMPGRKPICISSLIVVQTSNRGEARILVPLLTDQVQCKFVGAYTHTPSGPATLWWPKTSLEISIANG